MIFTLTDREYNVLDAYDTDDYLIGIYTGHIIKTLDLNVLMKSDNAEHWVEGNYIMCEDSTGYKYWFTIRDVEDSTNRDEKQITCYSGTLDIVNEDANPVQRPSEPQPFEYYFNRIFFDTGIEIGINEIAHMERALEFTSENASNVEMLQYVLNGFDNAEADLAVEFNGSTPVKVVLNVFRRIGEVEPQTVLTDEDDSLDELERIGSIAELATCLNPVGQGELNEDGEQEELTLVGAYYEELDEDGNIAYYSPINSPRVFSVKAREQFFVKIPDKDNGPYDGYINRRYRSEATTQDALWAESLAQLKRIDHPQVEYEARGHIDCRAGDNIQIISHQLDPAVMISARVMEYKFNDDDPSRNEYKFGNYETLESNIDELSRIIAEVKKSVILIDSQVVEYVVDEQGDEPPASGWTEEKPELPLGMWLWTRTITHLSNGDRTTAYSVSHAGKDGADGQDGQDGRDGLTAYELAVQKGFNGTEDEWLESLKGQDGEDGRNGVPGERGEDGRTPYIHYAWANSADGTQDFTLSNSTDREYIGMYTDFTEASSSNPSDYSWTKVKGEKGDQGERGPQGPPGQPGSPGRDGADGQNAITGYLTNEAIVVPADPNGVVSSFADANGYFRVMDGNEQALSGISFSVASATGITTSINNSGYYTITAMSSDFGSAVYQAVYKGITIQKIVMVSKARQGQTGPQGPPTGIVEQNTVPGASQRYVGMLWINTGASGYINGATYRWNGSNWTLYMMHIANLSVENLAAISANLGTVTAGILQGTRSEWNLGTGRFVTTATNGNRIEMQDGVFTSTNVEVAGVERVRINGATIEAERNSIRSYLTHNSLTLGNTASLYDDGATFMVSRGGTTFFELLNGEVVFRRQIVMDGNTITATGNIRPRNNHGIHIASPSGVYRRDFIRGTDDWVHVNADGFGRTRIHGNTEATIVGSSDRRLKTAIKPSDRESLDVMTSFGYYTFEWTNKAKEAFGYKDGLQYGVIAQELADCLLVQSEESDYLTVDHNQFLFTLGEAFKQYVEKTDQRIEKLEEAS